MIRRHLRAKRSRGQSLVEFALAAPVLLLLLLVAIDFGRVYLGWVNLQSMSRIAANFAANNAQGFATNDPVTLAAYQEVIQRDATANNCRLQDSAGVDDVANAPVFSGYDVGDTATVALTCRFGVITPVISNVIGSPLAVSASSQFPVKSGMVDANNAGGGGGGGGGTAVTASFSCTPRSGATPLTVQCNDESGGGPTSWSWVVNGPSGSSDTSTVQDPIFTLSAVGSYSVTLTVNNALNQPDSLTFGNYLVVSTPSNVDFIADRNTGPAPLAVQFTDQSTGSPTAWAWDFQNNGSVDSTIQNPSFTYTAPGTYDVKLTVTNAAGSPFVVKTSYIFVGVPNCTVPLFTGIGLKRNNAQALWVSRSFTTIVQDKLGAPKGNYTIGFQSITNGQVVPCNSVIQVSDK